MPDIVDAGTRSRMMSGIRGRNTKPEMQIRSGLHRLGYRFRLHDRRLPGRPDLVFPSRRAVIEVRGCFWHGHDCHLFRWPETRKEFWHQKISQNVERDERNRAALLQAGWRVAVVWECQLRGSQRQSEVAVLQELGEFLEGTDLQNFIGHPGTTIRQKQGEA